MDSDYLSAKFLQSALQSRSDLYIALEEMDAEDECRPEFPCPFCSEDFDIVSLCCHIDEVHSVEASNALCPICATRVGMDMVGHITMQHGHFFKLHRRRKLRKGSSASYSRLSLFRKELQEGHLQSLFGGSCAVSSSSMLPDPLLSSFMSNVPLAEASKIIYPHSSDQEGSVTPSSKKKAIESIGRPFVSDKDQKEKAQKCAFVQGLVLSTFLGEDTL